MTENLEDTARRELEEETGVKGLVMEQIGAYGDYDRDPRTRVITTAFLSLVKEDSVKVQAGDDAADAVWFDLTLECRQTEESPEQIRNQYLLTVYNQEKKLKIQATVEEKKAKGLICEQKFRVLDGGMLASDHAAIIVHALTILKNRL